jgi:hypothetical protein
MNFWEQQIYEHRKQAFKGFYYLTTLNLIPYEIAEKRGLTDFPRDPYVAVTSDKWRKV